MPRRTLERAGPAQGWKAGEQVRQAGTSPTNERTASLPLDACPRKAHFLHLRSPPMSETLLRPPPPALFMPEKQPAKPMTPPAQGGVGIRAERRPADRHRRTGARRAGGGARPGAARRHRLGQDLHHGQGDRGGAEADADPGAEQDAGGAALRRDEELLPRQRGGVFRFATTITTSRRRTSRAPTPTSKKTRRSTSRSTACATRPRRRCWSATT